MNHLDDHDIHQERFNDYDNDYDMKDTGPLNLGKKSNKLGKHEQPYVVVPNMRPLVFVGPSLKGYEVSYGGYQILVQKVFAGDLSCDGICMKLKF